jgi:hypothetical protein
MDETTIRPETFEAAATLEKIRAALDEAISQASTALDQYPSWVTMGKIDSHLQEAQRLVSHEWNRLPEALKS